MSSNILTNLGLIQVNPSDHVPIYAGGFLIWNFIWAYAVTSTRTIKIYYKIDHNENPREDVIKYGERAVKEGKISQQTLNMIKRNEAAHANTVEGYSLFVGAGMLGSGFFASQGRAC